MKIKKFPYRALELDFEKDILPAEQKLITQYGFVKEEINFIMRLKPSFILFDLNNRIGINTLHKYFVQQKGFDIDLLRTLVVKYPYILQKDEEHLNHFFGTFQKYGFKDEEIMRFIMECPKLISVDIDK